MENYLDTFDHVVVLMMENRSFDNMLGYLGTNVNGVVGKGLSNPGPLKEDGTPVDDHGPVPVRPGEVMDNPNPDPGEFYPHVGTQLYNLVDPPSNAYQASPKDFKAPYNRPPDAGGDPPEPTMTGFVQDYYNNFVATQKRTPTRDEYSVIMECFPTEVVPVISRLASSFGVCDNWHCAVPSQTFCNRSFFHAATANGNVVNTPFDKWVENDHDTIFNRIQDACDRGLSWAVYYDKEDVFPATLLIHFPKLWPYFFTHFHHMDRFYDDVARGCLPSYSFVEPRLFLNHNDQHPPIQIEGWTQPSTVTAGEELMAEIYNAIRASDSTTGSNCANTLFVITYDEHGGCYDHVPPPPATPPDDPPRKGQMGFTFDQLGVRVPAVLISAWIENNVITRQLQHTSLLKTLCDKWQLDPLTCRDASAPTFAEAFNRSSPRPGDEWPDVHPIGQPPQAEDVTNHEMPLNDLQQAILGMVHQVSGAGSLEGLEQMKVGEALALMSDRLEEMKARHGAATGSFWTRTWRRLRALWPRRKRT